MNVVFPEMFEDQGELDVDAARRNCGDFVAFDARVNQIFLDDRESTGIELFFDGVECSLWCDAPSCDFDVMEAGLGRQECEARSNRAELFE